MLKFYNQAGDAVLNAEDASFCSLGISQSTINAANIVPVVEELSTLSAESRLHRALHHKVSIKWVGYITNAPFDHEHIAPFMRRLCQQWPYFLHYAALFDSTYTDLVSFWYEQEDYKAYFQHQISQTLALNESLWTFHNVEYRLRLEQEISHFAHPPRELEAVRVERRENQR
ncbi:hypothetical protein [Aestuariibacter salexigens]|uniref:hypothetical protein n=1 Tax=Aestuariibacter salexigens TaxID=226010 RepID=UPI00047AC036|nr:hypothetical protein [Aestuariibacter salexigens]